MIFVVSILLTFGGAPPQGLDGLVQDLKTCKRLRANRCVVAAMRLRNHGCKATKLVAKSFADMSTPGQILALGVLDSCSARAGTKSLVEILRDPVLTDVVRSLAVDSVARRSGKRVAKALLSALHDKRPTLRAAAARALGNRYNGRDAKKVMTALIGAAQDRDATVRLEALIGLRLARFGKAGPVFTSSLTDKKRRIRQAGADGLRQVRHDAAVRPLIETLRSRNGLLREIAVKALTYQTGMSFPEDYPLWLEWYESR